MFVGYSRKLPECKVSKYIKLPSVTNTEDLDTISYNYKKYLYYYMYTLSNEELKTIFYAKK